MVVLLVMVFWPVSRRGRPCGCRLRVRGRAGSSLRAGRDARRTPAVQHLSRWAHDLDMPACGAVVYGPALHLDCRVLAGPAAVR
jgi:hypothetical protein